MLGHYFGAAEDTHHGALQLFKLASEAREAMWGVLQIAISALEVDFEGYAAKHASGFFEILDTIDLDRALARAALVP